MTNQLPAFLQNRQVPKLAETMISHLGVGSPPYISIMGQKFTLVDATGAEEQVSTYDPKIGPYLDCVIVDAGEHMSKIFYDKPFDPNAGQWEPPACFSDNGVGPSRNASKPQAATCAVCPNSAWGSATSKVSGKGIKACSDYQKLAILIPGDEVTFLLRVPPNSLSNLRAYTQKFVGQQVNMPDVITRISFDQQTLGTLKFEATSYIDEASAKREQALWAAKATDTLVGRTDMPREPGTLVGASAGAQAVITDARQQANVAPQMLPAQQPAQQAAPPLGQQNGAAAPAPEQPRRRRRNTAQTPAEQPAGQPQLAPFQQQPAAAPTQPAQPATFGIQQGQAPDAEIEATLTSIFGPAG